MISYRHADGDQLQNTYVRLWFDAQLKRIQAYFDLGDEERVKDEVRILYGVVTSGRLPDNAVV